MGPNRHGGEAQGQVSHPRVGLWGGGEQAGRQQTDTRLLQLSLPLRCLTGRHTPAEHPEHVGTSHGSWTEVGRMLVPVRHESFNGNQDQPKRGERTPGLCLQRSSGARLGPGRSSEILQSPQSLFRADSGFWPSGVNQPRSRAPHLLLHTPFVLFDARLSFCV